MASHWDPHRETIKRLYSEEGMPLEKVIDKMENDFQFSASKTAYERQLRKWGIRKNMPISLQKFLKIKLEQRRRQKKESHVLVKGVLLSKLEIGRVTKSYISITEQYQLESCHTQDGVTILTPTSDDYMRCVRSKDLPWIYFLGQLSSIGNLHMSIDMPAQTLRTIICAICPRKTLSISEQMEQNFRHLSIVLPVKRDEDIYSILHHIVGTNYTRATMEMLKLTVYLLSNKLLYVIQSDSICNVLLEWFQMGDNFLILKAILSHRLPTIEAFAEGIFASALKVQDRQLVRIFLDSGVNPNITINNGEGPYPDPCTPLQLATKRRNLGIVELLLKFDAYVDLRARWSSETPLGIAASNGDMEIAQTLISRGAAVNPVHVSTMSGATSPLQLAALGGHTELAQMLLDQGADINSRAGNLGCPLGCAIYARATSLIEMLLERGADIYCGDGGDEGYKWDEWDIWDETLDRRDRTPLQSAAMIDDVEMVQRLLQMGADVNASSGGSLGRTALEWAVENEDVDLCRVLLMAGANPNGWSGGPLAVAVHSRNQQLVEILLKHGAEINYARGRATFLELAIERNDIAMTRLLLSAGADPALGDPLILAIEKQNPELISMLSAAGANIKAMESKCHMALSQAVIREDSNLVHLLLEAGVDPNLDARFGSFLVEAAMLGNLEIIEILLRAGADYNKRGRVTVAMKGLLLDLNPLQAAAIKGNIDLVRYFLIAGADLNYPASPDSGRTALQAAVESDNRELIQFLIDEGADLNYPASEHSGRTALQAAVESHNHELVQFLIDKGADLNSLAARRDGVTALQAAISFSDEALVRMLLTAGADANDAPSTFGRGRNAIQIAAENGDDCLICLLLDHGADVNAPPSQEGMTALQAAAWCGHSQTVQLLLANGAYVNAPVSHNPVRTALQAAAAEGYLHIVDILLKAGANINAMSESRHSRKTALVAAAGQGRIDMLKLLLNAGADITTSNFGQFQLENSLELAIEYGHNAAAKFLKYYQIC